MREDYSEYGTCWDYFPHDHARSRAYRWGEDGLLGITDREGRLCLALALWNGRDPILKERLFGLTGPEGNHGEDVKECYFYLESAPTHSWMKALYKYPQGEYPYARLVEENRRRGRSDPEFELIDTGIFDDDRYWKGPTWINTNWAVIEGLRVSGEPALADELRQRTLTLVEGEGFSEYFSALNGVGFGADDFSWTAALTLDLLESA